MEPNKVTAEIVLLLIGEIAGILLIVFGSLIVFSAVFLAVTGFQDAFGLGIGIELQLVGAGLLFLTHRAINKAQQKQADTITSSTS